MPLPSWTELEAAGLAAGLDVVAAAGGEPFTEARTVIEERRAAGIAGTMQFTYRNPERSTDPDRTLPGVQTLVVGATSYHREPPSPPAGAGPVARVARYVWADDQARLLAGLQAIADLLVAGGARACVVADQNHLVDRAAAARAGLGWYGKNANLLLPGRGSWYLLGSVLTDAVLPDAPRPEPVADGCGPCERCVPACPTAAIVAPGVVDGRRCLSWLLQAAGPFPREHRAAVGDRIYGCDECQEVCPPNRREDRRAGPGGRGVPVPLGRREQAWVAVLDLLAADDATLLARHGAWYIANRDPSSLRRNALLVLANVGDPADPRVRDAVAAHLAHPDPVLRGQAVWSAKRLGCDDLLVDLHADPDPLVLEELALPAEPRGGA